MAQQTELRASGKTGADEAAKADAKDLDRPTEEAPSEAHDGLGIGLNGGVGIRPEDEGMGMTLAFSRMRTDWNSADREIIQQMHKGVDLMIENLYHEIFAIMYQIYRVVRLPISDPVTGEVKTDVHGLAIYQTDPDTGMFKEDWSRMGSREREDFIYKLTTGLFRWEQKQADMYGDALFARARYEEVNAHGYRELPGDSPTIQDRTAQARIRAADDRYFAVYTTLLSRRADAVVRSAERLCQRLKDLSM